MASPCTQPVRHDKCVFFLSLTGIKSPSVDCRNTSKHKTTQDKTHAHTRAQTSWWVLNTHAGHNALQEARARCLHLNHSTTSRLMTTWIIRTRPIWFLLQWRNPNCEPSNGVSFQRVKKNKIKEKNTQNCLRIQYYDSSFRRMSLNGQRKTGAGVRRGWREGRLLAVVVVVLL